MKKKRTIHGVLLLYHHNWSRNAPTIMEHVLSFTKYSKFNLWSINTEKGFPSGLNGLEFDIIMLHYSLFGSYYLLNRTFKDYLEKSKSSYKIAFFQDEHHYCQQRFAFLNRFKINCVYTLLHPDYYKDVYQKYTGVPKLVHNLTGYVSDELCAAAEKFARPDEARNIDIGYRGRSLKFYMGKGSQEKYEIGKRFVEAAKNSGLKLDIQYDEENRLYGDKWFKFLGNQKGCLGTEAGVSIFDVDDVVRTEYERLISKNPGMTFEEMSDRLLKRWEGNIPYRAISPRHFEAAAFRICQILYEGEYQGIMKPMIDYIPLKKDFSNFDEVIRLFRNAGFRRQITDNCYRDLIASGKYSYKKFIEDFDRELIADGFSPGETRRNTGIKSVTLALSWDQPFRVLPRYSFYFFQQKIFTRLLSSSIMSGHFVTKNINPLIKPLYRAFYKKVEKRFISHENN